MKPLILALALGALAAAASAAEAADAQHGRQLFRQQCGACHLAGPQDGEGGQGPNLAGVVGRRKAGDRAFAYSPALSAARGVWTPDALAAYLENPQRAIPGSMMPARVPAPADRADIVAYLAKVKAGR